MSVFLNRLKSSLLFIVIISLIVGGLSGFTAGLLGQALAPELTPLGVIIKKTAGIQTDDKREIGPQKSSSVFNEDDATIEVVKRAAPAVVSIVVMKEVSNKNVAQVFPFDDFFKDFGWPFEFKIQPAPSQPKTQEPGKPQKQQVGGGSGFFISADGLILTNKHVVSDGNAEYIVVTNDGKRYSAKVLATDPILDVAVLKIEATGLPILKLGDSDKLQIGQAVVAIGNALGQYNNTVTKGVISGINRRVVAGTGLGGSEVIEEAIQTDAAINPGNSGGPLLNLAGEAIGINTAISREGQLVGFSIPVNQVKKVVESVQKYGRVVRPWLGVRYININKEIAEKNNLSVDYGAFLVRGNDVSELAVIPGSPADKAGLVENDIILEAGGIKLDEDHSLSVAIGKYQVGSQVKLKVLRQSQTKEVTVVLEEMKK